MPRIKVPTSRIQARSAAPSGALPNVRASASDFAAASPAVGQALQNVGRDVTRAALQIDRAQEDERDNARKEELANLKAQSDPTPSLLAAKDKSLPDGSDLYENTRTAYRDWIEQEANTVQDAQVRSEFRRYWLGRAPAIMSSAAEQAHTMKLENSRHQVDQSLTALENRVRMDPNAYDEALGLGYDALAPHARLNTPQARTVWQQQLARARFEAKVENATTVHDLDEVRAELTTDDWQASLSAQEYDNTVDMLEARRARLRTSSVAVARSYVSDIENRTNDLQSISRDELRAAQKQVSASGDAALAGRLARAARNQQLMTRYRAEGPEQLSARASITRAENGASGNVHPQVATAIDQGVAYAGGRVSAAYLTATAQVEYGGELGVEQPDFGVKASTSSATGLYQFTDDTWLAVVRGEGDSIVKGAASMSDVELLGMRSDPNLSAKAAAALAVRNRETMERTLSRPVTDFELYLGHFMGSGRASAFISLYETDETAIAATMFPREAEANRNVFYDGEQALTTQQVYDSMAARFGAAPGRVQHEDAAFIEDMANNAKTRINENMMGYARETGIAAVPPLTDEGGPEARANAARIVSSTWRIPLSDMQPLEPSEVSHYKNILSGEDPDAKTEVMGVFASMGPTLAQKAYEQLGVEGNVYAHGGGLLSAGGNPATAYDIVRGQTFIENNRDFMKAVGLERQDIVAKFGMQLQPLVAGMGGDPATGGAWQTVLDATIAHYVQTQSRRGVEGLDTDQFKRSLNMVLGGTDANPVLAEVNGDMTVLPRGVSEDTMDAWMRTATEEDWKSISVRNLTPMYANGDAVTAAQLRANATLEPVGANQYRVKIDGQYLTTGREVPSGAELFVVQLSADSLVTKVNAATAARSAAPLTSEMQRELQAKYGANWAFDTNTGQRLSDAEIQARVAEVQGGTQ